MGEERAKLTRHGTANAEAYELYLKGKHFRYTERPKEMLRAKDYFEEAIRKDPNYAAAYAGHAENYMLLGLSSVLPRDDAAPKARQAAEKALEIDPDLSEAHVSLGVVKMVFDWDWKGAEREFQRAIAINPNNFDAHREYAWLLLRNFKYYQSEQELIRSQELDPLNSLPLRDLRGLYLSMGLTDKAQEVNKKLGEIDPFWARQPLFGEESSIEDAEKTIQEYGRYGSPLVWLARAYYQKGRYGEASKIIQELEALYEKSRQGNVAFMLAYYFSETIHDKDKSLMWLNRADEGRAPALINVSLPIYFTFLQKEPRFQEVLKKVGLK